MDALLLGRLQFAANISFHILFPTIRIGMGWLLLFFRLCWLKTRGGADRAAAQGWLDAYRFWTKVFALTFALGVVSGITMSFQFGTNWPGFVGVLKYMAEKPEEVLHVDAVERAATPVGATMSPVLPAGSASWT